MDFFDENVRLIGADDGDAPRDAFVMSKRDTGKCGFAGADHVPAWRVQMHQVAQRRQRNRAMRIARQQGFARRRELARDGPVITLTG